MIFELDHNSKTFADALNYIGENREMSLDTETTGLAETDRLFCVTLSGAEHQVYVDKDFIQYLKPFLDEPHRLWHFQNPKFDMRMLLNEGLTVAGTISDNAVLGRLVRNDHMKYNLKSMAARIGYEKLDVVEKEIQEKKLYEIRQPRIGLPEKQPRFDWVDRKVLKVYACADADITYKVAKHALKELDTFQGEGNALGVWNTECDLTKVCFAMERRGVKLNEGYTLAAWEHALLELERLKADFAKEAGVEFVDSGKALSEVFSTRGLPVATTAKGNPSFTDEILEKYQHPLAEKVRDIREVAKTISTYYVNFLNMHVNGVIHPTMWQAGTRTGRFSYSEPNLQQLTKDKADTKKEYLVRGCFMPREGKTFISMDYSQQEYRMMLAYANETELIKQVMDGADVHQATADLIGIDRQSAKTLNFAILYGAGEEKLAKMLGVSRIAARRFKDQYFMKLPRVERLIDDIIRRGRSRGYVYNWAGRRLFAEREFCYALPNHLIQGGGADVVKRAMVDIGVEAPMLLQVHDQLIFEVDAGTEAQHIPKWKHLMENAFPEMNGMRLKVDVTTSSKSLAEKDMVKWLV